VSQSSELLPESELEEMEDPESEDEMSGNRNLDYFPVKLTEFIDFLFVRGYLITF